MIIETLALLGILGIVAIFLLKVYAVTKMMDPIYELIHIVSTFVVGAVAWFFLYTGTTMAFLQEETATINTASQVITGSFKLNLYEAITPLMMLGSALFGLIIFLTVIEFIGFFVLTGSRQILPRAREINPRR